MSTRFEIDPVLGSGWHETIARREYLLSPLMKYLRRGVVRLSLDPDNVVDQPRFICVFSGEDVNGAHYDFASSNTDGELAIDDTVARLRRTLTRRHQNNVVQHVAGST